MVSITNKKINQLIMIPFVVLLASNDSLADDTESANPVREKTSSSSRGVIEEVIVTVQRREQNLQDVPVMVSVFSADDLVTSNISESHGLQLKTPGMVYNSQGGYAHIYIRGIGSDGTIPTSEGSIATFLDGVYNPNSNSAIQHFADVQRVEVLKGPQGTLFGRNTTGGAINITTKNPSEEFEASIAFLTGSYERRGVDAYMSVPLGEILRVSLSGFFDESESYYETINPVAPPIVDNEDSGARVKLLFDFNDSFSALLTGYLTDHYGADTAVGNSFRTSLLTQLAGGNVETSNKPYKSNADRGPYFNEFKTTAIDLKLTYTNEIFELKSITAMLDTDNSGFIELDYTEADLEEVPVPKAFTKTWSQELQLNGELNEGKVNYLLGAFYLESEGGFYPLEISLGPTAIFNPLFNDSLLGGILKGLFPNGFPDAATLRTFGVIETEAWAVFGNGSWNISNSLTVSAGLRYSNEMRTVTESRTEVRPLGLDFSPTILSSPPEDKTWDAITPMVSIEWRPDEVLYYLKYSEGFKSGNYNPVLILEPITPVEPERINAYEIGLKGDFLGRSLRFNMAGFFYNYDDLQVQIVSLVNSGTARIENAGNAQVYGAEFQFEYAATSNLIFNLGGAWMESEYTEYIGTGYDESTGLAFTGNFSGNELNRAPELTASGDIKYTLYLGDNPLELGVSAYYASGWYFDAQNTFEQESYKVYGGHISYFYFPANLKFSLVGSNITSTEYLKNALLHDFGVSGTYAPPRQIVGRIDWEF